MSGQFQWDRWGDCKMKMVNDKGLNWKGCKAEKI